MITADVAVIGGGMGGVAAALSALRSGLRVILTEETTWLGGQMTAQGVSALDEHPLIEHQGGTFSYYQMRNTIRAHYAHAFPNRDVHNPGGGWVSRLCFEPIVGVYVLNRMLHPYRNQLTVLYQHWPIAAQRDGARVMSVTVTNPNGDTQQIEAAVFIDATELGDLLPLLDLPYVTGAESQADTGEAHAPDVANPNEVQSFTFPFAVDFRPNESHVIDKPQGYEHFRDNQPYSFTLSNHSGSSTTYRMFDGELPFWTYRRIFNGQLDHTADISMINWHGNDYYGGNIIDQPAEKRAAILDEAKRLALGFLYWLQTEAPRDEGGFGYPEIRLRRDVMGTDDGLSKFPYVRESRRIVPRYRIVESDISAADNPDTYARDLPLSVGVGWYHIDLHACVGNPNAATYAPTKPFQIPLGALLPEHADNLIAGNKNIGTTHLTNGAYRLHPVEWNIGESAGALAAYMVLNHVTSAHTIHDNRKHFSHFKTQHLMREGIPTSWEQMPHDTHERTND